MKATLTDLVVSCRDGQWWAACGPLNWRCAIGFGGVRQDKQEGDGATPIGSWPIRRILYRADRMTQPGTQIACAALKPSDGWCDDPSDPAYNTAVRLPFAARHERLWRDDDVYDCIGILGHNDCPPVPGAGSAIFLHIARPGYTPTEGCVALARADLLAFLAMAQDGARVCVLPD